jgi:uncharacterized membrane protein
MSVFVFLLAQASVLAFGLVSGVFLAFSDFIMRSLAQTGGSGGVEAMQVINREVFRWMFMTLFLGLAPVSLVLVGLGVTGGGATGGYLAAAGLLYLVGCFGVTVVFNVPMNTALGTFEAGSAAARDYWFGTYLPNWTFWNGVRAVASAGAAILTMTALLRGVSG